MATISNTYPFHPKASEARLSDMTKIAINLAL